MKLIISFLLVGLLSFRVFAAEMDFTYQGHPVHPSCVCALTIGDGEKAGKVKFSEWPKDHGKVKKKLDGTIQFDSDEKDLNGYPYDSYKVLDKQGDIFVLEYEWCGGGTGIFSGILGVRIEKDWLVSVYHVVPGDRCNGGLSDAWFKDGKLIAREWLTPPDILNLSPEGKALGMNQHLDVNNPDKCDLDESAISCYGEAQYLIDPATGKQTLMFVDLGSDLVDALEPGKYECKYQECFDRVYNRFITEKKSKLDAKGLAEFVQDFKKECANK